MSTLFDVRPEYLDAQALHQANAALSRGEVVVVPTDTVYGLAVCPRVPGTIEAVVGLKGRSREMAPPMLVTGVDQVTPLVAEGVLSDAVVGLLHQFWPGGFTVVLPVNPDIGMDIGQTPGTIALRCPEHQALLELLRIHGPLAVTSANKTGEPPCQSVFEAIDVFGSEVSVYLNGGDESETGHVPSTIVDASGLVAGHNQLRIIREGAVSVSQLEEAGYRVVSP